MHALFTTWRASIGSTIGRFFDLFETDEGESPTTSVGFYISGEYASEAGRIFALALRGRGVTPLPVFPIHNGQAVAYDASRAMPHHVPQEDVPFSLGVHIDFERYTQCIQKPLPRRLYAVVGARVGVPICGYVARTTLYAEDGSFVTTHLVRCPYGYRVATRLAPVENVYAFSDLLYRIAEHVQTRDAGTGTYRRIVWYLHAV